MLEIDRLRKQLEEDVAKFLAQGGEITKVPIQQRTYNASFNKDEPVKDKEQE